MGVALLVQRKQLVQSGTADVLCGLQHTGLPTATTVPQAPTGHTSRVTRRWPGEQRQRLGSRSWHPRGQRRRPKRGLPCTPAVGKREPGT